MGTKIGLRAESRRISLAQPANDLPRRLAAVQTIRQSVSFQRPIWRGGFDSLINFRGRPGFRLTSMPEVYTNSGFLSIQNILARDSI